MATYTIKKKHGSYNRSMRTSDIKYIVMHYTGSGSSKSGAAKANCIYFGGGNRNASAHYFIDDANIYEYADPKKYYTWHCGDGHGKYGITNANSIGIEVCLNGDKAYTKKEIARAEYLVKYLMKKFGVKASHVVRHYDASRKMCPYYYAKRSSKWKTLRKKLTTSSSSSSTTSSTKKTSSFESYKVKITTDSLNVRKGPGTDYDIVTSVKKGDTYTIVGEKSGKGATKWLELKSGEGYISSDYVEKV